MKPIIPSFEQIDILRRIAAYGFDHDATKQLCAEAQWELVEDEPDLGFVQYFLWVGPGLDSRRLLSVGTTPGIEGLPHEYLPLFYFPDQDDADSTTQDRAPFDDAFRQLANGLGAILGKSRNEGSYEHPHRLDWSYAFHTWRVQEAQIVLLQDEHDIQFGMDVGLWLFPAEPEIEIPLPY